ncbi:MAG: DUF4860 domain-containing protein [Oscillospiraceae bacterium]
MNISKKTSATTSVLMLVIFSIFSVSSFILVIIGANSYKSIINGIDDNNQIRATLSYVTNKVRQNDCKDAISVEKINGEDVLILASKSDEEIYKTYIYHYKGKLYESYLQSDVKFIENEGEEIVEIEDLNIALQNDMLTIIAMGKGKIPRYISLHLKSK